MKEVTSEEKEIINNYTAIEIIENYCDSIIADIENALNTRIDLSYERTNETKEYQEFKISFIMSKIIVCLKFIGNYYKKKHNKPQIDDLDYGLKLFLIDLKSYEESGAIQINKSKEVEKIILDYILDEAILDIKQYFLLGHENIPQHEMLYVLHNFCYYSPIHQDTYSLSGDDIRRNSIGRIEMTSLNKYQDYRMNINNLESQLLNAIRSFNYNIKQIVDITIVQKEVQYRTNILNEVYFNMEHFLSILIKEFRMNDQELDKQRIRKKEDYLSRVLNELDIKHDIDFAIVSKLIKQRCPESSYIHLLEQEEKQTVNYIDIFSKIINMRNSLHSNGFSNKDVSAFKIAKINYDEVKKDEQFTSMAMHQLIPLFIIIIHCMELITEQLSKKTEINGVPVPTTIIDKYVKELRELREEY